MTADYGVALQDFFADGNWPAAFVMDRQGAIRFTHRSNSGADRTPVERLLQAVERPGNE
jgi:hypothetical protein